MTSEGINSQAVSGHAAGVHQHLAEDHHLDPATANQPAGNGKTAAAAAAVSNRKSGQTKAKEQLRELCKTTPKQPS